jgi:hypothetical protein
MKWQRSAPSGCSTKADRKAVSAQEGPTLILAAKNLDQRWYLTIRSANRIVNSS